MAALGACDLPLIVLLARSLSRSRIRLSNDSRSPSFADVEGPAAALSARWSSGGVEFCFGGSCAVGAFFCVWWLPIIFGVDAPEGVFWPLVGCAVDGTVPPFTSLGLLVVFVSTPLSFSVGVLCAPFVC